MSITFAPLFLLILIIALICLAVYGAKLVIYIGRIKLGWLLTGYFALLICSPVVLWLLPPERLSHPVDATSLRKAEAAAQNLFPVALTGRPQSVNGVRTLEWQFRLDGESLKVESSRPNPFLNVMVEKTEENDGIIEATYFFTGAILGMIDVSAQVRKVEVTLTENTLIITEPEHYKIELIKFSQDFMAAQILGEDAVRRPFVFDLIWEQLLYLRIPQGVQLQKSDYYLLSVPLEKEDAR